MSGTTLLWQRDDGAVQLHTNRYDPKGFELHVRHVGGLTRTCVGLSAAEAEALAEAVGRRGVRVDTPMIEFVGDGGAEDPLLTTAEVAAEFRVASRTVTRWARKGTLTAIPTPGGRSRFRRSHVRALLEGEQT